MINRIIALLVVSLIVFACKSGGDKGAKDDFVVPEDVVTEGVLEISEEVMQDIVQNISSPVEMAALVKSLNANFSNDYLAPTDNVDELTTAFQQAFNLGVYAADLGYLNIYNKTNSVIDYITAIKTLADGVRVGQFFDFTTLKRLAQSNQNLDSLMYISVHSFNQMDKYLRTDNRSNLSTLMVTGVWIEGLYLATQVAKEDPHPELAERIGEQKIIMNDLMVILENYKSDKQFNSLIEDLRVLKSEFNDVSITIQKGEPEAIEENGMLVIIQNDISIVNISPERLQSIIEKTEKIRNKLISL
ncbi:MAG: hypothetical protein JW894_09750 [Bacteroidales bacterium]|nr:hypothetical protein [Bacteroidales bacterium]